VRECLAAIDQGHPVVLVVGRAGTGKTKIIRYLRKRAGGECTAIVAPTGVAALNAGAQTIHSLFQLPHHVLNPADLPIGRNFGTMFRRMNRLIIDEVSMVRADILDAIDWRLRRIRGNPNPFGGVGIFMTGDFLQLPPVVTSEARPLLHALGYKSPFAFSARVLQELPLTTISLDKVWRQSDPIFVDFLDNVRTGKNLRETAIYLNEHCLRPHRRSATPVLLTPTRQAADSYNQAGMAALPGAAKTYDAVILGNFDVAKDRLPAPEHLALKVGARVMMVKNDLMRRWVNGSLGTVVFLEEKFAKVKFDLTGEIHGVGPVAWEKIKQVWNEATECIDTQVIGSFSQIPIIHGWALTIHKAQGLTMDDVRIDLGSGAFAPGQVYVALSRVKTMAGLSMSRPLRPSDIEVNPMLIQFTRWLAEKSS
jgi:ATP-dependent DNA helicase PIF1